MFSLDCDPSQGVNVNSLQHSGFGYLLSFNGLGLSAPLKPDIKVYTSYNGTAPTYAKMIIAPGKPPNPMSTATVVGILSGFNWKGGANDPITISAYVSGENAGQLQALLQTSLKNTSITGLTYWITDYDQTTKEWYEKAHPLSPLTLTAQLKSNAGTHFGLAVEDYPTKLGGGETGFHGVTLEITPAANSMHVLHFANNSKHKIAKGWGLEVGTDAAAALPPGA